MKFCFRMAAGFFCLAAFSSCTKSSEPPKAPTAAEKGKQVYLTNCIACHNPNPALNGAVGPSVAGASLELLRARIMSASYPEGYKPKRETKAMAPLPHLQGDLEALHAFLNP